MYPQRSVMTCGLATALEPPHFNPRTRVGCDTMTSQFCRHFVRVSIHAPAWGATSLASHADASATAVSIHAPAWGATLRRIVERYHQEMFQSTHPRGVRHLILVQKKNVRKVFQSTHPRGVRHHDSNDIAVFLEVSIHAPAWGATK